MATTANTSESGVADVDSSVDPLSESEFDAGDPDVGAVGFDDGTVDTALVVVSGRVVVSDGQSVSVSLQSTFPTQSSSSGPFADPHQFRVASPVATASDASTAATSFSTNREFRMVHEPFVRAA